MAKVKNIDQVSDNQPAPLHVEELLILASQRIDLPNVPMVLEYHDDVDTLMIQFKMDVSPALIDEEAEIERGVVGIYDGEKLVGLEILDVTGRLEHANPR